MTDHEVLVALYSLVLSILSVKYSKLSKSRSLFSFFYNPIQG